MNTTFGAGLFVCNDSNGSPCKIGDTVKVTEPSWRSHDIKKGNTFFHEAKTYEGKLELDIKMGFRLTGPNLCFQPPFNDSPSSMSGRQTWKWELVKTQN